jgi:hypothetical protein
MVDQSSQSLQSGTSKREKCRHDRKAKKICTCEHYGRYGALLIPREVFRSCLRATSGRRIGLGNAEIARDRIDQGIFYQSGLSREFWTGLNRGPD